MGGLTGPDNELFHGGGGGGGCNFYIKNQRQKVYKQKYFSLSLPGVETGDFH